MPVLRLSVTTTVKVRDLAMKLEINEMRIETNNDGFLSDPYQWEPVVSEKMADVDGVKLTDAHWAIISFLRDYYDTYEIAPDLRILSRAFERLNSPNVNMAQLATLFPQPSAITACRYAGLPKPIIATCG
jgi:tRNA 2-thiouridine synthesizing protein E